ncbi:hypothetical protein [Luedemannella helvata]|uniref:FXSXX-COOH protein n=1 Tax=Luedemannella helvata TaxID=349315 RepID=A0ABN2KE38_9ACTN
MSEQFAPVIDDLVVTLNSLNLNEVLAVDGSLLADVVRRLKERACQPEAAVAAFGNAPSPRFT